MFKNPLIAKILHWLIGAIVGALVTGGSVALASPGTPTVPHTFTVSIYHGKSGTSGFEGVATCHVVKVTSSGRLYRFYRCTRITH